MSIKDKLKIIKRLVRIYTPFICAIMAIIHGVLYFYVYKSSFYSIMNQCTGHSFLLIGYILSTCDKMCKWYKITCLMLMIVHVPNILYIYGLFTLDNVMYSSIIIGIISLLTYILYRVSVGITKFLC